MIVTTAAVKGCRGSGHLMAAQERPDRHTPPGGGAFPSAGSLTSALNPAEDSAPGAWPRIFRSARDYEKRTWRSVNLVKRTIYKSCILGLRAYRRLFLDVRAWGRENIPTGPKLYVFNHISIFDSLWMLPLLPDPPYVVIGPPYKFKLPGMLFDWFGHINAMPEYRRTVVDESVKRLEGGGSVLIAPEGDIQDQPHLGRFYPGVARIYRRIQVPIIPIGLVSPVNRVKEYPFPTIIEGRVYKCIAVLRGPYLINIGEPLSTLR